MKNMTLLDIQARLEGSRMNAAERLDALASLQRGEAIADLILTTVSWLRRARERVMRILRRSGQGVARLGKIYR